jgi:UDP-GlcNAc:undecaprenyl-phosphate GlcNAc-1-phosphate transferase
VHALPFVLALAAAALLAPGLRRALVEAGHVRPNYRQRAMPFPFGVLIVAAAGVALVPLGLLSELAGAKVFEPGIGFASLYTLGVALLGVIDDTLAGPARGWRGHAEAVLSGGFSTGALKAVGSLGLALLALGGQGLPTWRYLLGVAVLVLATNLFNLLDLRPGRSVKVFVVLAAGLTIGAMTARPLWLLGLFAAPALVAGFYDLREQAMLGDTGANLIGALAGLWLVLSLSGVGQAVAAAVLVAITIYGEFRSINALVARTPGLRTLDSLGRP